MISEIVGTAGYMAPEVITVLFYILISYRIVNILKKQMFILWALHYSFY